MTVELAPIPRAPYALIVGGASIAGVVLGVGVAQAVGGAGPVLNSIAAALVGVACLTIVPLLGRPIIKPETWGLAVMGVSAFRTLAVMGAMMALTEGLGLERRPVVYGVLSGGMLIIVVEGLVAAWLLTRRERQRTTSKIAVNSSPRAGGLPADGARSAV